MKTPPDRPHARDGLDDFSKADAFNEGVDVAIKTAQALLNLSEAQCQAIRDGVRRVLSIEVANPELQEKRN